VNPSTDFLLYKIDTNPGVLPEMPPVRHECKIPVYLYGIYAACFKCSKYAFEKHSLYLTIVTLPKRRSVLT